MLNRRLEMSRNDNKRVLCWVLNYFFMKVAQGTENMEVVTLTEVRSEKSQRSLVNVIPHSLSVTCGVDSAPISGHNSTQTWCDTIPTKTYLTASFQMWRVCSLNRGYAMVSLKWPLICFCLEQMGEDENTRLRFPVLDSSFFLECTVGLA